MGPGRRFIELLRAVAFSWPLLGLSPWRCHLTDEITAALPVQQIDRVKARGVSQVLLPRSQTLIYQPFFVQRNLLICSKGEPENFDFWEIR